MKMSTEGLMTLIGHEAIVLTRYKDSVGVWTLGVGHTAAAGPPIPANFKGDLTVAEVFDLLRVDIKKYEDGVSRAVKVPLKQHEFDALVSFHFNTGQIGKASFVKKLNAGDRAGAMIGIMAYKKPPEIIGRRTAERDLFKTGRYPAPFATIYPATATGKILWGKGKSIDLRKALKPGGTRPAPAATIPPPIEPKPAPAPVPATDKAIIMAVQQRLLDLGYPPGGIDGKLGKLTASAIRDFRAENSLPINDTIDDDLQIALGNAKPRALAPERANATSAEVAAKVPEAAAHSWIKTIAGGGGGTLAIGALTDAVAPAKGYVDQIRELAPDVPGYVYLGIGALFLIGIAYMALRGQAKSTEAFKTGERL